MIVPSIDLMDGRAVQLVRGRTLEIDAGDPRPIAQRFAVAGEIAVIDLDAALGRGDNSAVIRELLSIAPCRVGGGIRTPDQALDWLDAGAHKVILGTAARPDVLERLPAGRVIAALDAMHGDVVVEGWTKSTGRTIEDRMAELHGLVGGFLVTFVEVEGTLGGIPLDRVAEIARAAGGSRVTFAGGIRGAEELAELDRLGADGQVGMAIYSGELDLADALAAPLVSDRTDGLWATLIEDETGRLLGLAWSDAESLRVAVNERRGVYRSRSRGLWRKGETSGASQELLRVRADCDRDALLFTVRQAGSGFCHTGAGSCFDVAGDAPARFSLADLETRIRGRLGPAAGRGTADGSLTSRLAGDPAFLAGKIMEEAGELVAAETPDEAVAEFADLMYFALTRLVLTGGSLVDVNRDLQRRSMQTRRRAPRAPAGRPGGSAGASSEQTGHPSSILPIRSIGEAAALVRRPGTDGEADRTARMIVEDVRGRGESALREYARRFDGVVADAPISVCRDALQTALAALDPTERHRIERVAARIRAFAEAQRATARDLDIPITGGRAGHRLVPVRAAGCYAPGGRFPLPSSVLMTVIPARVAGVETVWVASPRPTPHTLAAAAIAGADGLLAVGGAQAIAALAFGLGGPPPSDLVVGPGNRFVTAAKRALFGEIGIDMLAGPSEVLVVADADVAADEIAVDLLAQAEHDPNAVPLACVPDDSTAGAIRDAAIRLLEGLPTRETALPALSRGGIFVANTDEDILEIIETVRPEHLQLLGATADRFADRVRAYGGLFLGGDTAEVFGDYGAGPNHTLPTGGTAGFSDGLSVFTFLRRPTWLRLDRADPGYDAIVRDTEAFARIEGLEAHARAASFRRRD